MGIVIGPEIPGDLPDVLAIIEAAFGGTEEARLFHALRQDGDVALAYVADLDGTPVAHAVLSKMRAPQNALGLAPVSVHPDHQGRGIGTALVQAILDAARDDGWGRVFAVGDPAFYDRFGFTVAAGFESRFAGPHFMALELVPQDKPTPGAAALYAAAFDAV